MNNVKINNTINLTYPDSYREMGDEELTRYFSTPKDRWGVYDSDRHIILSVSWSKVGFLTDEETALFGMEARMRRNLLNYQQISSFKTKIASKKKACGVRFEYRVNDAKLVQVADLIVFKNKNRFYYIYFITRRMNAAAERLEFEEILKSITAD